MCYRLYFIFFCSMAFGQSFKLDNNQTSFWDYETQQPISIINDSLYYYGNDFQLKSIPNLNIDKSDLSYMIPVHIKGKTYLFDRAGGVVVEYANQSYKRHDKSFSHKNLFYSAYFTYNNEIYILGGYGLFTTKNILIRYDFEAREWFLVDTYGDVPEYITSELFTVIDNKLYFVNSGNRRSNSLQKSVYVLDLNTFKFKYLGKSSFDLESHMQIEQLHDGRLAIMDYPITQVLDFTNNSVYEVKLKTFFTNQTKLLKYDINTKTYTSRNRSTGTYTCTYQNFKASHFELKSEDSSLLYEPVSQMEDKYKVLLYPSILIAFLGLSLFGFKKYKNFNKINLNLKSMSLSCKGRKIEVLTEEEKQLFFYLAKQSGFIEYSELLNLFDSDASYETQKKKRQQLLTQIEDKLKLYIRADAKEIFIIKKSLSDKRNKVIKVNHQFFTTSI
ncbi:hypothetical protein [Psychroflexus salis]|nr:hypothetical protein [Psychroflexus salis]